ncbi:MOSC domain-containing protein [Abditibacterium utsteinense]|uniref:MOSC domain-containing protein n=1 Tax=Abditibacterium utsteinense TaxID=1960156 RepID=A0A2S8SUC7_9BACT|nr:MOSC domain-containing protein [Abditibacterium utsteinense]PQV64403.1 MOSC domain-containing protein [Abditibacterium utsteinense]
MIGKLVQISVSSSGGVPKSRVESARLGVERVEGDKQNNLKYHGGPSRAVCLYSLEIIEKLQAEGHSIAPGSIGENLTISGFNWNEIVPGVKLQIGAALVEITDYTRPCFKIKASFKDGEFMRPWQKTHPGESRVYAKILTEAVVHEGDEVFVLPNHAVEG